MSYSPIFWALFSSPLISSLSVTLLSLTYTLFLSPLFRSSPTSFFLRGYFLFSTFIIFIITLHILIRHPHLYQHRRSLYSNLVCMLFISDNVKCYITSHFYGGTVMSYSRGFKPKAKPP